jgi:DNA polymerase
MTATLDWWRAAGVDCAFSDDPQAWLAEPEPEPGARPVPQRRNVEPAAPPARPATPRIGGDPAAWPKDIDEFARWWLTEPSLDPAPPARRVPPMGKAGAELMVLVPVPEEGDEAVLLSGRAGQLLDSMLAAMGLSRDRIYLAAALPSRVPAPDWAALGDSGMREVLAHHVALAAPQRLLVLGRSVVSALLSHDPAKNTDNLRSFNHESLTVPVGAGMDLEALLARPALKAGVWKLWLEWTSGDSR